MAQKRPSKRKSLAVLVVSVTCVLHARLLLLLHTRDTIHQNILPRFVPRVILLHTRNTTPQKKFAAIKDVAEFVGSPLSDSELCCIATEGSKDMGSHTTSRKERGKITSRFGKWKVRYGSVRCERTA